MSASVETLSFGVNSSAVLIGTSVYKKDNLLDPIPHVVKNIEKLLELLIDRDVIGLDPASISLIVNESYASEILTQINKIAQNTRDTLIVYYAGHGLYGDEDSPLYLASTHSTDHGKAFDAISLQKLKKILYASPARKKIVILDCCFSGSAVEGRMAGQTLDEIKDIAGTFTLASVPPNSKGLALPGETYTVFSGELIKLLEGGDEGLPKILSLEMIFKTIRERLRARGGIPVPIRSNIEDVDEFRFAFNQFGAARSAFPLFTALKTLEIQSHEMGAKINGLSQLIKLNSDEIKSIRNELNDTTKHLKGDLSGVADRVKHIEDLIHMSGWLLLMYKARYAFAGAAALLFACIVVFYMGISR
jgi:hypothetical protein